MSHQRTTCAAGLLALCLSGCTLVAGHAPPIPADGYARSDVYMRRTGFTILPDPNDASHAAHFGDEIRRVYLAGSGPPVVLLHELPGLRPEDVELASELSEQFTVYVPLLFGVAGQSDNRLGYAQACASHLFSCEDRDTTHPITTPLRVLVRNVCVNADCGIVGMCLTGSLPLWLITEPHVVAIVLAQPSLPLFHPPWPIPARLDISDAEIATAATVAVERGASIYLTRYRHDLISSHRAFATLTKRIASRIQSSSVRFRSLEVPGHGHSTLVRDSGHAMQSEEGFHALIDALNATLRPSPASPRAAGRD